MKMLSLGLIHSNPQYVGYFSTGAFSLIMSSVVCNSDIRGGVLNSYMLYTGACINRPIMSTMYAWSYDNCMQDKSDVRNLMLILII